MEDIKQLQSVITDMQGQIKEMYEALVGNKVTKDGGLVGRIQHLEISIEKLDLRYDKRIGSVESRQQSFGIYQKIIWGVGCTIGGALTVMVFKLIFK